MSIYEGNAGFYSHYMALEPNGESPSLFTQPRPIAAVKSFAQTVLSEKLLAG